MMNFDIKRKFYAAVDDSGDSAPEETVDYLVPRTRLENSLAKIADNPNAKEEMEPRTRTERLLNEIAARLDALENGGSSGERQFVVTLTYSEDDGKYHSDKTEKEIKDMGTEAPILVHLTDWYGRVSYQPVGLLIGSDEVSIYFGVDGGLGNDPGGTYLFGTGEDDNTSWTRPD